MSHGVYCTFVIIQNREQVVRAILKSNFIFSKEINSIQTLQQKIREAQKSSAQTQP